MGFFSDIDIMRGSDPRPFGACLADTAPRFYWQCGPADTGGYALFQCADTGDIVRFALADFWPLI